MRPVCVSAEVSSGARVQIMDLLHGRWRTATRLIMVLLSAAGMSPGRPRRPAESRGPPRPAPDGPRHLAPPGATPPGHAPGKDPAGDGLRRPGPGQGPLVVPVAPPPPHEFPRHAAAAAGRLPHRPS